MNYFIQPDRELDCPNDFPEGLSYFFEQVGGYGEGSEVAQVSGLLGLDLSAFQHYGYFDDEDEPQFWQDLGGFIALVDAFLRRLAEEPHYYRAINHRTPTNWEATTEQLEATLLSPDTSMAYDLLAQLPKMPQNPYPEDRGYLSSGQLGQDLQTLRQTLACYQQYGAQKIMLIYG
ncbi:hypothetical protein B0919_07950 [Hymenobacter sp. CRA2]|nr:hypothetical protein B0919_07950 [Hymenobacter sp. CRA2]